MMFWRVARAAIAVALTAAGCAIKAQPLFFGTPLEALGSSGLVQVLQREPIAPPLRYRVIVIPGSGCTGMKPVADRYFAGLLHAQVMVLHKPGVDLNAGLNPEHCPPGFVQSDNHASWLEQARHTLRADARSRNGGEHAPQLLIGISEGAELLAGLASEVPNLAGLVLVSGSGLDPVEAGEMQAQRLGQLAAWQDLGLATQSSLADETVLQGRSLRYWRDLWSWRQSTQLIDSPWSMLQVWGEEDALVPKAAYATFRQRASGRVAPWCSRSLAAADHGLQSESLDGVQQLWAWLENWGRKPGADLCGSM